MRFLLDENIGKSVSQFLQHVGHTAYRIKEINPGIEDYEVLRFAVSKSAVLITSDKDFGELIFKEKQSHFGVILLRLNNQTSSNKIASLQFVLSEYQSIGNDFIVITEKKAGGFNLRVKI